MAKNDYLLDTLALCVKSRKAIFWQVVCVCLVALVLCLAVPEWYKSEARIIPPSGEESTSFLSSLMSQIPVSSSLFGMSGMSSSASLSMAVLESRSMMESAVQAFDLIRRYRAKNLEKAVKILKKRCSFNLDEKGIIRISVTEKTRFFHSTETTRRTQFLVRDLATFMANRLDSVNRTLANEKARGIRIFYEKRYSENLAILQSFEEGLRRLQEKHGTIALPQQTLAAISAAARLKADIMAKEMEIGIFNQNFGPNNANTQKAQVELDYLKKQYNRLDREDPLDPNKLLPGFQSIPAYGLDYARSIRNIKVQGLLVELLLNQLEQARLQELKDTPTIQVLDPANLPVKKTRPQRALVMVLAFFFSVGFSMFAAVLVEKTRGIRTDKSPRSETLRWMARELSGDLKKLRPKNMPVNTVQTSLPRLENGRIGRTVLISAALQSALLLPGIIGHPLASFLIPAAVIVLLFFFSSIENALILLPIFIYMPVTLGLGLQLSECAVLGLLVIFLFHAVLYGGRPRSLRFPMLGVIAALLASEALSLVHAPFLLAGVQHMLRMVEGFVFIFYLLIHVLRSEEAVIRALRMLVAAGCIAAVHGMVQSVQGGEQTVGMSRRIFGLQGGGYGGFLGVSLVTAVGLWMHQPTPWNRILLYFGFPVLTMALILHQTRAWYGSVAVALIFIWMRAGTRKKFKLLWVAALFSALGVYILFSTRLFNTLSSDTVAVAQNTSFELGLSPGESKFVSSVSRFFVWWKGFQRFQESPIVGVGVGNLRFQSMLTGQPGDPSRTEHGFVDNQYLNVLYETGMIGMVCWIVFLVFLYKKGRIILQKADGDAARAIAFSITGSLIVILAGGLFWCVTVTHEMTVLLAYLSGLLVAAHGMMRKTGPSA